MNVKLTKAAIDYHAEQSPTIGEFVLALYKQVYGESIWNQITEIDTDNYPQVGHDTWQYICQICIDKSTDSPPDGGLFWMNRGFSATEGLTEWQAFLRPVPLEGGGVYPTKEVPNVSESVG